MVANATKRSNVHGVRFTNLSHAEHTTPMPRKRLDSDDLTTVVNLCLPVGMRRRLTDTANRNDRSVSAEMRRALVAHLDREDAEKPATRTRRTSAAK